MQAKKGNAVAACAAREELLRWSGTHHSIEKSLWQSYNCINFEYCITNTIMQLLALLGIEDNPTYKWNRIANQSEETQMVLTAVNYLDEEAVLNHLPWLTPEEVDKILKHKDSEDLDRLDSGKETDEDKEQEDEDGGT